ncbi:MAG: outer membrane protein assembly factor BamA [Epsilonproteobacteria bacterium]|nr:outer membrane protein assembly factor BamA [Campylobacterota bacterium]
MIRLQTSAWPKKRRFFQVLSVLLIASTLLSSLAFAQEDAINQPVIKNISVVGNKYIGKEIILNKLPYRKGEVFDPKKSSIAIKNLYDLGHFRQVQLEGEEIDEKSINLEIHVQEKKLLEQLQFTGNHSVKTKTIKEKLNLAKLVSVDEEVVQKIERDIEKIYREEGHHAVSVEGKIIPNAQNPDKATALFTVVEGAKSILKRVYFVGAQKIPERRLRNIIQTREMWLLAFMDGAGAYADEIVEIDRHRIEFYYRNQGYLNARVAKTDVQFSQDKRSIEVTFYIQEGDQYTLDEISAPGDEFFTESELLKHVSLEKGQAFSQEKMMASINRLKDLWGEKGYIHADVYPQVKPNDVTKTVDVTFQSERGSRLYVNRILITGNTITRDKVIRRQLEIAEGDLITTNNLKKSQSAVEYLSYFERGSGVNWRIHRLSEDLADLEINVKETKTGQFNFNLSYGSDVHTPRPSLRGQFVLQKTNLFGLGYDVGAMLQGSRHRIQKLEGHFLDPHILDSNVAGGIFLYKKWDEYDQWVSVTRTPIQKVTGGYFQYGIAMPKIDKHLQLVGEIGIEDIRNKNTPIAPPGVGQDIFQVILRRTFETGTLQWLSLNLVKDTRNHQMFPSAGYRVCLGAKTALPLVNDEFSFWKTELEASYYTALIGKDDLVLVVHGKAGYVDHIVDEKMIPYKELFHMGGQTTVRGFVWGSIGPATDRNDPLGARAAILFNTELIFPLIPDYSMRGHVFYDAGAGWSTPKRDLPSTLSIKRDRFDLRHSVGFGINLMQPMPAKIDWGFKLDRRKQDGESAHEFHLQMQYAW